MVCICAWSDTFKSSSSSWICTAQVYDKSEHGCNAIVGIRAVLNLHWLQEFVPFMIHVSPSLHFNGHFPGGPGLVGIRMSPFWILLELRVMDVVSGDNWSYETCKAPVKSSLPTNQHPVVYSRMSFVSPNQQCQSTEGNSLILTQYNCRPIEWNPRECESRIFRSFPLCLHCC